MQPNGINKRRPRRLVINAETLEPRSLMTGGAGSMFAVETGTVATAGLPVPVQFTIDPKDFTLPKGKMTIGVDIAPGTSSTVEPFVVAVLNSSGRPIAITHAHFDKAVSRSTTYDGSLSSAVTAQITLPKKALTTPQTYTVEVMSVGKTTGAFEVGFYLPGDANGDGTVDQTDIKLIKSEMRLTANSTKYTFDADANRSGNVDSKDMAIAKKNLGVKTSINPTVSANLDPAADPGLSSGTATSSPVNYTGVASPGATVTFKGTNANDQPVTAVADSTGHYTINVPLDGGENVFQITTKDSFGQSITGTINPVTLLVKPPATTSTANSVASNLTVKTA